MGSKEIQPVNPKGNQPWIFVRRTDAEAEAPVLWPPDAESTHWNFKKRTQIFIKAYRYCIPASREQVLLPHGSGRRAWQVVKAVDERSDYYSRISHQYKNKFSVGKQLAKALPGLLNGA